MSCGVSSIYHPIYVQIFEHLLSKRAPVELTLTRGALNKILTKAPHEQVINKVQEGLLTNHYNENLRFALTLTDTNFSLSLFSSIGEYDDKMDFISFNPQAIKWGKELFQQTLKNSVRAESKDVEEIV